jgi:hypothetical protein
MAIAVLWFSLTRDQAKIDWKAIITASVWRQLSVYLWPEIHKWARRIRWDVVGRPPFDMRHELLQLQLKLSFGAATAVASDHPEQIEGAHAEEIFYGLDEAKIILPGTWDAIEGALSTAGGDTTSRAYVLAMSTPGPPSGRFYDIHRRAAGYEDWHVRHVTLEEAIAAGRISREWAEQRKRQWGENSAMYQGRVLGNFHSDEEESVIPLSWVEAAQERWHEWAKAGKPQPDGARWTGVDVARGGDESVLAIRHGHVIELKIMNVRDTMAIAKAAAEIPGRAIVDVIGVGAGVYDRLRELKLKPLAYTGSEKSPLRDRSKTFRFVNTRSAAYWHLRELLDPEYEPTLCLPPDDLLTSDLTTPRWETLPSVPPRIKIENKDDVIKRLGRSPDRGDACLAEGTMILTADGELPIELVLPGMMVWTRAGLRRVIAAEKTGVNVPLVSVFTMGGHHLTGTGNHPVWDGGGFRRLDAFAMGVNMYAWQKRASSTRESSSPGTPTVVSDPIGSTTGLAELGHKEESRPFTLKYTGQRLVQSRTAGTFITKMETRWTIVRRILKHSLQPITRIDIFRWKESISAIRTPSTCASSENSPSNGMPHLRGDSGTLSTVSEPGKDASANRAERVSDAAVKSKPLSHSREAAGGALDSVITGGITEMALMERTATAKSAKSRSGPSYPILPLAPVRVVQKCDGGIGDVWNLEVEGQHEYLANGILVHNCAMSLYADAVQSPAKFTLPDGFLPTTSLSLLSVRWLGA